MESIQSDEYSNQSPVQFLGSEVRRQLDAAYFLFRIVECDLESTAKAALDCLSSELDELQKELLKARGDVSRSLCESLSDPEHPLYVEFLRIISEIREKTTRRLNSLKNIREMSLPEGFRLRPTQERFLEKLQAYFEDGQKRSGFVKYPTGMGKTVLIGLMIRSLMENDEIERVLVLSPRNIINKQNLETITLLQDKKRKIFVNEIRDDPDHESEVHVGTYQLAAAHMGARKPKSRYAEKYDVIFLDECHRSFGGTFMRFLRLRHPESIIIGLSATPYVGRSLDPRKLKSAFRYFEGEIDSITLKEACEEGSLPSVRAFRIDVNCEDYTEEDRTDELLLDKINKGARIVIAKRLVNEHIPAGEKTLIFCAGIEHAKRTAAAIGKKAAVVHGKMTKTQIKRVLDRNKRGEIDVLTTADLLIEGFDDAEIRHIVVLRPTMSMWIYEQMIGRGTRLDPNDPDKVLTIWDVVGQHSQQCTIHGLHNLYGEHQEAVRTGDILFGSRDVKNRDKGEENDSQIKKFEEEDWGGFAEIRDVLLIEDVAQVLIPRDEEYYHNSENIRADLESYAKAMGKEVAALTTSHSSTSARCNNGETVKWQTYLSNAAVGLGLAKNNNEAHSKFVIVIEQLKTIAGIELEVISMKRDSEYYNNSEYVRADLESYAEVMGTDVVALPSYKRSKPSVQCSNGETVRWDTYLRNAAVLLGFAENSVDAGFKCFEVLNSLKELVGVVERDKEYYQNPKFVKHDLEAYATAMGKEAGVLNTKKRAVGVKCSNGETVKWGTYLANAAVALGLASNAIETRSQLQAVLNKLKLMTAVEDNSMKKKMEYYQNSEKVKADLEAYAKAMGKEVSTLSIKMGSMSALCSNGKIIKWQTYLYNAAIVLGFGKNNSEVVPHISAALRKLKEIAGVVLEVFELERDLDYYQNRDHVKADLEAYAKAMGKETSTLSTDNSVISVTCSNGEKVKWRTYLSNAVICFGLAGNQRESVSQLPTVLKKLKKVIGIEIEELSVKRDSEYYHNREYVKADLEAYAKAMGKEVGDLNTGKGLVFARCSNGETVKWITYLSNATRCLGLANSYIEQKTHVRSAMKKLKEIAGIV